MSPAPLQAFGSPVHFCPIAVDDSLEVIAQEFWKSRCGSTRKHREDGICGSHRCPQPCLLIRLLCRCFVHEYLRFVFQSASQILAWLLERCRNAILHVDRGCRAAGQPGSRAYSRGPSETGLHGVCFAESARSARHAFSLISVLAWPQDEHADAESKGARKNSLASASSLEP